jgi:hypothetical protein
LDCRDLGRSESPLPCHQLVAVPHLPDYQGLDNAVGADGLGELFEAFGFEESARLQRVGVDLVDRDI